MSVQTATDRLNRVLERGGSQAAIAAAQGALDRELARAGIAVPPPVSAAQAVAIPEPGGWIPGPEEDPYYGTPYASDATPGQILTTPGNYVPPSVYVTPPVGEPSINAQLFGPDIQQYLPYIAIGAGVLLLLMMRRD